MINSKPSGINSKRKCPKSSTLTLLKIKMKKSNIRTSGTIISKEKENISYTTTRSSNNL